jgi:superfamily II DNA/RNA helicase
MKHFRKLAYNNGTPRELLFADVICSLVKKRFENSTWLCLPNYSNLSLDVWHKILQKKSFIRELWPAQHLLGEKGIYRGASAVVQMPTSAGKTRAIEIIIRSAFLSGRTSLAVIVAPFRALCHEIKNDLKNEFYGEDVKVDEFTDVFQADFEINTLDGIRQVLVMTPEKLSYALRHAPEMASSIGLLLYDEGHQFDSGSRGVTYELLITSLKKKIPNTAQTILISAVISNADSINKWLNGASAQLVLGQNLIPTHRTLAFTSWLDQLGRLEFVEGSNPEQKEFFVPRIIEQQELQLRPRERTERVFPIRGDGQTVALFLGLKLVQNGGVAIFCGTKATAAGLCGKVIEAYSRGLSIPIPASYSDKDEMQRLFFLYGANLGIDATATLSAKLGIFAHHANTPHGIRLAVEHAIKEGLARFVVCTSTLTQGVNLPIRYLIVTSVYQGKEQIKVRDFHNLIGRAGRSGMYTEGSIIFADPEVYDKRKMLDGTRRWLQVKELLKPSNSEPCVSTLLSVFEPFISDDNKITIEMEPMQFAQTYIENPSELDAITSKIASMHSDKNFSIEGLSYQIDQKINIISAIQSYLMAHWDDSDSVMPESSLVKLAEETLAYYLADEKVKSDIISLFKLLTSNIEKKVPDAAKRKVFGKILYGVSDSIAIEKWVNKHIEQISNCSNQEEIFSVLWPAIKQHIHNATFRKCTPSKVLKDLTAEWIQGSPYYKLFEMLNNASVRFGAGPRARHPQIEHVIEICEKGLAYDGMLIIGAITEICGFLMPANKLLFETLQTLQKRVKYGLNTSAEITIYELGFSDRVVAKELSSLLSKEAFDKVSSMKEIRKKKNVARNIVNKYPKYYSDILENIINK